jgi:very-short-patch-repair endonuclease
VSHTKGKTPWNKGLTKETDTRVAKNAKGVSNALKGRPSSVVWTDEMRKAKSEWRKKLHIDFPETHPNRRLAGNRKKMSYPEKVAFEFLTKHNVVFEHNKKIDKFYPDFVVGQIVIEIDGANWHDKEKDKVRDEIISSYGYKVVRILSSERIEEQLTEILRLM